MGTTETLEQQLEVCRGAHLAIRGELSRHAPRGVAKDAVGRLGRLIGVLPTKGGKRRAAQQCPLLCGAGQGRGRALLQSDD